MDESSKKIVINGSHNRNLMKKMSDPPSTERTPKKRVESEKWTFDESYYNFETQLNLIKLIKADVSSDKYPKNVKNADENSEESVNVSNDDCSKISKIIVQQISKKISGYKQQDLIKKKYLSESFLTFESVIDEMISCGLKCRYCNSGMLVLYDISRETKQWSVDRIDNDLGHNVNNFHLACLDCNLKRRRRTDEKFLFTKQLNLVKVGVDHM
jgi:hypothetical protein